MRLSIATSRSSISIPVSLELIAAILQSTPDAGLPAGECVTIELDSAGNVTVIRDDNTVFSYIHPRAARSRTVKQPAAQLKLAI